MTYIELLNRFWDFYRVKKFSDIDTAIYFFLLNECNIRRWLNPFELQTRNIEICFGISRKTIGEARNRLKQRGLIDFIEAQGRGPTTYLMDGAEINNDVLKELFCVSDCVSPKKHKGNTNGNTKVTQGLHKGNTTQDSTLLIEERRYKTLDNPPNPQRGKRARAPVEDSLFSEKELEKSRPIGVKAARLVEFSPPTPEEVRSYFLRRQADARLPDWEIEADSFFSYYDSQGWVKSNGRKVANWESLANDWILRKEKELKQPKRHEPTITTQRHTPEDTLIDEQIKLAQRIQRRRSRSTFPGSEEPPGGLPQ